MKYLHHNFCIMIWTTTFRENKQIVFSQHEQSLTWLQKDECSTFQGGVSSLFFLCTVELFNNPTKKHSSRYSIPMKNGNATLHWQTKLGAKNQPKTGFDPPSSEWGLALTLNENRFPHLQKEKSTVWVWSNLSRQLFPIFFCRTRKHGRF